MTVLRACVIFRMWACGAGKKGEDCRFSLDWWKSGPLPINRHYLILGILLFFCFYALEEVGLRENTSASGSFILYINYHLPSTPFKLWIWELCHRWMCRQSFVLFWFFYRITASSATRTAVLVLGSKCFLELRTASLGKLVVSWIAKKKSWKICFLPLRSDL